MRELFERDGLRFAKVRLGGVERDVCLEYQQDAARGDYVLVHVGFAIAKLDAAEAARTLALLQELGELDELGGPPAANDAPARPDDEEPAA